MSIANFCDSLQTNEVPLRSDEVGTAKSDRPVFHEHLGERLRRLRVAEGWSIQRAVNVARGKHHAALTPNRLRWLEEGKTKFPDREVLRAVCDLYKLDYREIASAFISANYGNDLIRHWGTGKQGATLSEGASDVPASARIRELEARLEELEIYKSIVQRLRPAIRDVLTAIGDEDVEAPATQTKGRRRH